MPDQPQAPPSPTVPWYERWSAELAGLAKVIGAITAVVVAAVGLYAAIPHRHDPTPLAQPDSSFIAAAREANALLGTIRSTLSLSPNCREQYSGLEGLRESVPKPEVLQAMEQRFNAATSDQERVGVLRGLQQVFITKQDIVVWRAKAIIDGCIQAN